MSKLSNMLNSVKDITGLNGASINFFGFQLSFEIPKENEKIVLRELYELRRTINDIYLQYEVEKGLEYYSDIDIKDCEDDFNCQFASKHFIDIFKLYRDIERLLFGSDFFYYMKADDKRTIYDNICEVIELEIEMKLDDEHDGLEGSEVYKFLYELFKFLFMIEERINMICE